MESYQKQTVGQVIKELTRYRYWHGKVIPKNKLNKYQKFYLTPVALINGFFDTFNGNEYEFYKLHDK